VAKTQQQLGVALEHLVEGFTILSDKISQVRDELVSSNGIRRRGALARPIINGASIKAAVSAGQLAGYSLRETAGAAAVVRLRDGVDASGDIIVTVALPANGSANQWYLPHGIAFTAGLFVEVASGAVEGVVYIGPGVGS
jgi:hypothetical protein